MHRIRITILLCFIFISSTKAQETEKILHQLIDSWHIAAATADEETFFGLMTSDAIYIGTEAGERWLRDSLREWSAPYFERSSAWSFKPIERQLHVEGENIAWFDELLETRMGICKSTGIMLLTAEGWKIRHYQLSVTVKNDLVNEFVELIKKDPMNAYLKE